MLPNTEAGRLGEKLAADYLRRSGFSILHTNWRSTRFEIDIVALKNGLLHFFEVKYRSSTAYGCPEESVTPKKIKFLLQAIDAFLHQHRKHRDYRLNIISILRKPSGELIYEHIEDVYL